MPPASDYCRSSDPPSDCANIRLGSGRIGEIGGPQGTFLEGAGLERQRFTAASASARGVFPPPPGTQLIGALACSVPCVNPGDESVACVIPDPAQPQQLTVVGCSPIPELAGTLGAYSCQVNADNGPGICASFGPGNGRLDGDPLHHRGVTAVRGFWDASGAWHDDASTVTLSCDEKGNAPEVEQFETADGTVTKCIRQWLLDPSSLRDAFLACVRMARADYCGDGHPHTFNGTDVALATPRDPPKAADCSDGRCYEASWSKDGAVCIARPRWSGPGMGFDACRDQFVPVGKLLCRADPSRGIVFSRSQQHICNQHDPGPCGPDEEPVCAATVSPVPDGEMVRRTKSE